MLLDGRPLSDLSLDDIRSLVDEKTCEGPNVDFKQTAYSPRATDRREMLRDITAFANAAGGYLILGVQEDGLGRAERLSPFNEPFKIAQAIKQTCLDGISERIQDIEIRVYETGPDQGIIAIRIPPSDQLPHMVVLDNRTEFVRRYGDDKRAMTIGEIRRAITSQASYRQIVDLELTHAAHEASSVAEAASGPPYVQALTEGSVNKFIYRFLMGGGSTQALVVVSPFISDLEGATHNLDSIIAKVNRDGIRLIVITRPPIEPYQHQSIQTLRACPFAEVRFNPDIHAKLYLCWKRVERESFALFGSGNLTRGGSYGNIELGVLIFSRGHGRTIIRQLYHWSAVGLRASSKLIQSAKSWRGGK